MTDLVVYLILVLPFGWSIIVAGLRWLMVKDHMPSDAAEKYQLLITIAPILLGLLWLGAAKWLPVHVPLPPMTGEGETPFVGPVLVARAVHPVAPMSLPLIPITFGLWGAVALVQLGRWGFAFFRLGHIASSAVACQVAGVDVRVTQAAIPPLVWGRSTILLPESLAAQMSSADLGLILRHEQAHLNRRDSLYFAALAVLDALAWFNPFLRAQTQCCRLAAELACDAYAMGKNPVERETYARVLIRALKHTAAGVRPKDTKNIAPAVVSNVKSGDYRMRLSQIMHADPSARKPKRRALYIALALALVPIGALQFAWAQGTMPAPAMTRPTSSAQVAATPPLQMPMAGAVSSPYGWRKDPRTGAQVFHRGIDIAGPVGTTVVAPADGKIGAVYTNALEGKVVEIDHDGDLHTRLSHLDAVKVKWGDHVTAGQAIAVSGNTGTSVAPHLHFEVLRHRRHIDPMTVLPKTN